MTKQFEGLYPVLFSLMVSVAIFGFVALQILRSIASLIYETFWF